MPPQLQQQTHEKKSGFTIFGITIGAAQPKKPLVQRPSGPAPSAMRLNPEARSPYAGEPPRQLGPQQRATAQTSEAPNAIDDELEIPAFLRRQVN